MSLLNDRLNNQPERQIAAAEQHKITRLRLNKLIEWANGMTGIGTYSGYR